MTSDSMAKRPKARAIPAIEALHDQFRDAGPAEYVQLRDAQHDLSDRLGRLSWAYTSKVPFEEAQLLERLAARPDWMIFPDTNMLNIGVDDLWPALVGQPRRLAITTRVFAELDDVLWKRSDHPLHEAITKKNRAVLVRPDAPPGTTGRKAQICYLMLMDSRRRTLDTLKGGFILQHSRQPNDDEEAAILKMMQSGLSRERLTLVNKPASPYLTDEHLVYHAVTHALETGQSTIILSANFDVAAQFRHLVSLLGNHYRSMLLAERYEQDFVPFRPRSISSERLTGIFLDRPAVEVDLLAHGRGHPQPPEQPSPVLISCMTVTAQHVSEMAFKAETQMFGVVRLKGEIDGLSTNRLAGRNFHAWQALPHLRRGRGIVATDIKLPINNGETHVAMADWLLAGAGIS